MHRFPVFVRQAVCSPLFSPYLAGCLAVLVGVAAGCQLPQDPRGTLERVRGDTLHVGVAENAPWVLHEGPEPSGVEADMVRRLAAALDAQVAWTWGGTDELLDAVAHYELDLVAAGLTRTTPWRQHVTLTSPYATVRFAVGLPPGTAPPPALDGVRVAVERGRALAARLEDEGARPLRLQDPSRVSGPVAAPVWQLRSWGLVPTALTLHREEHVLALPPGENAWLARVDRFLTTQHAQVARQLKEDTP